LGDVHLKVIVPLGRAVILCFVKVHISLIFMIFALLFLVSGKKVRSFSIVQPKWKFFHHLFSFMLLSLTLKLKNHLREKNDIGFAMSNAVCPNKETKGTLQGSSGHDKKKKTMAKSEINLIHYSLR